MDRLAEVTSLHGLIHVDRRHRSQSARSCGSIGQHKNKLDENLLSRGVSTLPTIRSTRDLLFTPTLTNKTANTVQRRPFEIREMGGA